MAFRSSTGRPGRAVALLAAAGVILVGASAAANATTTGGRSASRSTPTITHVKYLGHGRELLTLSNGMRELQTMKRLAVPAIARSSEAGTGSMADVSIGVQVLSTGHSTAQGAGQVEPAEGIQDVCDVLYGIHQDVPTETLTSVAYIDSCNEPGECSYNAATYQIPENTKLGASLMGRGDEGHSCTGADQSIDTYQCTYNSLLTWNYENIPTAGIVFDNGGVVGPEELPAVATGYIHRSC